MCVMIFQCVGGECVMIFQCVGEFVCVCDDISVCRWRVCMCVMIFQYVGGEFVCV